MDMINSGVDLYIIMSSKSFSAKLELELAAVLTGRREVERRQDNLDRVSSFYSSFLGLFFME